MATIDAELLDKILEEKAKKDTLIEFAPEISDYIKEKTRQEKRSNYLFFFKNNLLWFFIGFGAAAIVGFFTKLCFSC